MTDDNGTINVLLVEDSEADAGLITAHLRARTKPAFTLYHETTLQGGISRLQNTTVDIILLDLTLPDSSGLNSFLAIHEAAGGIPIAILSGLQDDQIALEAVRQGAQDFFNKNETISEALGRLLQYTLERFHREHVEREIATAAYVQQRLYPKPLPPVPGIDVAGRCVPAKQVGGDYFDYFMPDDESLFLVIGDVSGHGFGPSLVMAETRAALRTLAATTEDVADILRHANNLLYHDEIGTFVSLFLGRLKFATGDLRFASAGQPAELLKANGTAATLKSSDPPLGVRKGSPFRVDQTKLCSGDTLLLYTDGISERSCGARQLFGTPRIRDVIADCDGLTAAQTIAKLFETANHFAAGRPQVDDMTAVVLKAISVS